MNNNVTMNWHQLLRHTLFEIDSAASRCKQNLARFAVEQFISGVMLTLDIDSASLVADSGVIYPIEVTTHKNVRNDANDIIRLRDFLQDIPTDIVIEAYGKGYSFNVIKRSKQ